MWIWEFYLYWFSHINTGINWYDRWRSKCHIFHSIFHGNRINLWRNRVDNRWNGSNYWWYICAEFRKEHIEFGSRTTGISDIPMPLESEDCIFIKKTICRWSGFTCSNSRGHTWNGYSIFSRQLYEDILESFSLIFIECHIFIIPNDGNSNWAKIICKSVGPFDIIPSSTSLINLSTLSYYIVISDISPTSCTCMIFIDGTDECGIISILVQVLSSMMKYDTIYDFCLLNRPDKLLPILISTEWYNIYGISSKWFNTLKPLIFEKSIFSIGFGFYNLKWNTSSESPLYHIFLNGFIRPISERFIRSPIFSCNKSWDTFRWGGSQFFFSKRQIINRFHRTKRSFFDESDKICYVCWIGDTIMNRSSGISYKWKSVIISGIILLFSIKISDIFFPIFFPCQNNTLCCGEEYFGNMECQCIATFWDFYLSTSKSIGSWMKDIDFFWIICIIIFVLCVDISEKNTRYSDENQKKWKECFFLRNHKNQCILIGNLTCFILWFYRVKSRTS